MAKSLILSKGARVNKKKTREPYGQKRVKDQLKYLLNHNLNLYFRKFCQTLLKKSEKWWNF